MSKILHLLPLFFFILYRYCIYILVWIHNRNTVPDPISSGIRIQNASGSTTLLIIGKSGAKIKEIRELTGANMNVAQESLPESNERSVEIIGTGEACLQTVYQVCGVLQDMPLKGEVMPYYPRAIIKDLGPSSATAAAWKPIILTGDRAYTIENGMAVLASPERL